MFDLIAVPKEIQIQCDAKKVSIYADNAQIESNEVFSTAKKAIADGKVTIEEKENILKEIEESERATAELKASVKCLEVGE